MSGAVRHSHVCIFAGLGVWNLCVCVCMHLCVHVCVHVCVHACVYVCHANLQSRWSVNYRSWSNMDTAVWVVIPKCKLMLSFITVAFLFLETELKLKVEDRVDRLTLMLIDWQTENRIPISRHTNSRCDKYITYNIIHLQPHHGKMSNMIWAKCWKYTKHTDWWYYH